MNPVTTIGLDIAKDVFQLYGADAHGNPLFNRRLRRSELLPFFEKLPACEVGIEACSTAHYWARCIQAFGHDVRLISPQYVKPFVKRGKTDANDAEAISEALTRKTMRFVAVKPAELQSAGMIFRTRVLLIRQRTQVVNALRSHLAELGIVSSKGKTSVGALSKYVLDDAECMLPATARFALGQIIQQIQFLDQRIIELDRAIVVHARTDAPTRRLMSIPGVGPITATAVRSLVPNPEDFKSARHFASWIGLTPRSYSSGGRETLGAISKMGNSQLRYLFVIGAMSVLREFKPEQHSSSWLAGLMRRRPFKVAAVALANKTARIAWAILVKGEEFAPRPAKASA